MRLELCRINASDGNRSLDPSDTTRGNIPSSRVYGQCTKYLVNPTIACLRWPSLLHPFLRFFVKDDIRLWIRRVRMGGLTVYSVSLLSTSYAYVTLSSYKCSSRIREILMYTVYRLYVYCLCLIFFISDKIIKNNNSFGWTKNVSILVWWQRDESVTRWNIILILYYNLKLIFNKSAKRYYNCQIMEAIW